MDRNHKPLRKIILKAGTLQASAGEQVPQTDITDHDGKADAHSAGHDGLSLPALVDCLQGSPRMADAHSAGHDGLSLPALVDCLQDSPRKADVHSAGHDGLSLPALVDCLQDSPRKADAHSAGHDGLSLPALVDCLQDSPRKADVHSAGHDGLSLPALVDCLQDSPRKNLVPKPPQGPRPSREANISKAENKATEVIKARRSREAKSGVKKLSHQVVGMLALPQTLTQTTSYSVLPAIKKGTKVTLQSSSSLSDDNKEALGAVCQVLTTRVGDILNSSCNDDYKARLIIQKGLDSGARDRFPDSPCSSSPKDEEEVVVSVMTVSYPKPSTSTQAAWAAPAQTLEKEVGGTEVSEMSDSSLMPTKNRQDPLEKIPSLLPGKEHILLCSTPWATVMSPQTLKFILHGIMCRLEASESPQTRRANDPFRLMKDLFVEVQHALKYADISVVFGLEESIQFSGEDAVKAIVKTAAKRLSLRSDSNRAQLRAARSGSEGAIRCMADTITQVIEDWSFEGHFGARRSRGSGRSHSSTSSRSDVTLTEELLAWRETLDENLEEMADDSTGLEKTSVSSAISEKSQVISYLSESTKPISSALSTDLEDITSTQVRRPRTSRSFSYLGCLIVRHRLISVSLSTKKKEKEEAMQKEVRKSGKKKRGNNKNQKKNKVSPLGNDSTVAADEPKKKQALLPRITAALAKLFCFPCKKKNANVTVQKTSLGKPCCHLPKPTF
ncbi:serine-rich adhesin for platelets-like isoform X8 [Oncorhynchus keta]|uniref:serine-rich adhesin for platelets-like isoform X7 n=1 Tax=Oncorhynchus keta TaxID=8018 RepID=UPI00227B4C79|nr:serine-rich adhesin for platelets-like isoform X7 [Oncorhynchus keta]XP_052346377.1 serine-rich adhesin for platelets-like isoform X8 [Oncorhynchus keta]